MPIIISPRIAAKLKEKHNVSEREVHQCFDNRERGLLEDDREDHKTDPPTQWFVAPTNKGRPLKVTFVLREDRAYVKSAYDANATWIQEYETKAGER